MKHIGNALAAIMWGIVKYVVAGAGVAALVGGSIALVGLAQSANAATDLANFDQVQQVSISNDGLYAPTLQSLTSGELGLAVQPAVGSRASYKRSTDGHHFVLATAQGGNAIHLRGDKGSADCAAFSADCVAKVTDSPELIASVPQWVQF
ncbi:hypothetical protein [Leifsonia xyli]|uniref:hypothetical protein n=1 Tax=Leifsonia xyli TaxID=1575 RepID=UPI003D6694C8